MLRAKQALRLLATREVIDGVFVWFWRDPALDPLGKSEREPKLSVAAHRMRKATAMRAPKAELSAQPG